MEAMRIRFLATVFVVALGLLVLGWVWAFPGRASYKFDGQLAYQHVIEQDRLGPRVVGTDAHDKAVAYIVAAAKGFGWAVETQVATYRGEIITNIVAKKGAGPVVIIGAHYDSRRIADEDKLNPSVPVPGANDGASGVAVLLELARTLDPSKLENEVWLAFFDAEDNGGLDGWDWIAGSREMARTLTVRPAAVIVVDMVGDRDQQIYMDANSDRALSAELWAAAALLGYGEWFSPIVKYSMLDDHTPFAELGIPAVDIIDFDYPYWHTTQDTPDKVSPESLERVGRTVEHWLEHRNGGGSNVAGP